MSDHDRKRDRLEPMEAPSTCPGRCEWCGENVIGRRYCSAPCRVSYNNNQARQGKAVMQALKVWRQNRGRKGTPGAGMLNEICARVDLFNREDRDRRDS